MTSRPPKIPIQNASVTSRGKGHDTTLPSKANEPQQEAKKELIIYPEYCHEFSPTILKWCPLRIVDIHALWDVGMFVDDMRLYHFNNHPIKWVKVVGVVVAVDEWGANKNSVYGRKVYTVDDGSGGVVECCCLVKPVDSNSVDIKKADSVRSQKGLQDTKGNGEGKDEKEPEGIQNPRVPWEEVDVGSVIKVKGRVGAFRDAKQIEVVRIEVVKGLDAEVRFWDEAGTFMRDVIGRVWVLSEEEAKRAKKRRDRMAKREWREREKSKKGNDGIAAGKGNIRAPHEKSKRKAAPGSNIAQETKRFRYEKETLDIRKHEPHISRETKPRYDQEDHDVALRILEAESRKRAAEEETRWKRHEISGEKVKRRKHESEGLNSKDRVNYPSLASRREISTRCNLGT